MPETPESPLEIANKLHGLVRDLEDAAMERNVDWASGILREIDRLLAIVAVELRRGD